MTLRVLGRTTSINVRKVLWTADELELAYEREDWGKPLRDPHEPEFLALNPNAQVPVIVEDGFVLWESNAIMTYLARKHGGLLPADAQGQAIVDQWLCWQLGELNPQWGYAVYALMRRDPAFNDPARIADSVERWTARLAVLEGVLATSPCVAGEAFSIADIAIALSTHRWMSTPVSDRPPFPAVEAHYRAMKARPAAAPWLTSATP